MIRLGVHCSLKKGLAGALEEAHALGCEAVQIFTRSPRMWRMRIPDDGEVREFRKLRERYGIRPLVIHTPYLPNLATADAELYGKSLASFKDDMDIAGRLGAEYFVIHPGAWSEHSSRAEGIAGIVRALNSVLEGCPGTTSVLLENVAGGGRRIGGGFAELAEIIAGVERKDRVGVCLDTAHALGAGYDVSGMKGLETAVREFDRVIGLDRLKVIHFNDSMVPAGSGKDRHQHIGEGYIGTEGFRNILRMLGTIAEAGILETPKEPEGSDSRNLAALFRLRDEAVSV